MSMSSTTPPETQVSAIFPFEPNKHLVNAVAAAGYALFAYPKEGYILIEADTNTIEHAMTVFTGGARAH